MTLNATLTQNDHSFEECALKIGRKSEADSAAVFDVVAAAVVAVAAAAAAFL